MGYRSLCINMYLPTISYKLIKKEEWKPEDVKKVYKC